MVTRFVRRDFLFTIGLVGLAAAAGVTNAAPARAGDFYHGKTLTVIIGFAPGGGVDTAGRVVARNLVRFIPGKPNLVVKNMEGAAGVIAANHLAQRVEPDGLTLAIPGRSWFIEGITKKNPNVAYDPTKLSYIGSGGTVNSVLRVRSDTGIKNFDDLKAARSKVIFGSLGSATSTAMVPRMLAMTGLPLQVVLGYVSTARVLMALEQGEVNAVFLPESSFALKQNLIRDKVVVSILQTRPVLQGVPLVRDVLPQQQVAVLNLVSAPDTFGLMLVGPSGVPTDRVDALRKAFVEMTQDKQYQTEASKMRLPVDSPLDGTQLTKMIHELSTSTTADVVSAYDRLRSQK